MRLFNLFIAVVLLALTVNAGDADSSFFSMTTIDGQTIVASSREQYVQMNDLVKTVNALKKLKSEKKITKEDYEAKVALLLGASFKKGVTPEQ